MKKLTLFTTLSILLCITSCTKEEGCTDQTATNYNAEAEKDDSSCIHYSDLIIGTWNGKTIQTSVEFSEEMTTSTEDISGMTIVFTETTIGINEGSGVTYFDYTFTSHDRITSDEIEQELGTDHFDIVTCTETDLVLTSQVNVLEIPDLQNIDITATMTVTCTR